MHNTTTLKPHNKIGATLKLFFILSYLVAQPSLFALSDVQSTKNEDKFLEYLDSKQLIRKSKLLLFPREDPSRERGQQAPELSEKVFNKIAKTKPKRIQFNIDKLFPFDKKGTCSAMALDFLARFIAAEKSCSDLQTLKNIVKGFKPYYRANTATFTSRQAAFNTVEIKPKYRTAAIKGQEKNKLDKIKSLALYHNLEISTATSTLKTKDTIAQLPTIINELTDGYYVIRMLSPNATNEKMENYGHTIILIKTPHLVLFFDNAIGAEVLDGNIGKEIADHISSRLLYIPEIRFYKAKPLQGGVSNISDDKTYN
jgi:hypothetical protein